MTTRLLSCALFTLPLAEGVHRLLLVAVQCCWQCVLDLWAWCLMQQDSLQCGLTEGTLASSPNAIEELRACDHMVFWCQHLYHSLQTTHHQLAQLNQYSLLALPWLAPWLPEPICVTPAVLWDVGCALAMLLILQLVSRWTPSVLAADRSEASKLRGSRLVVISFWCTVLLRVAWAPMCSISGILPKLYSMCAVALTSSTVFLCLAAIGKVLLNRLDNINMHFQELAEGTQGVVLWHRALVYLDWLLSMMGHGSGAQKLILTAKFICYAIAVDMCNGALHVQVACQ